MLPMSGSSLFELPCVVLSSSGHRSPCLSPPEEVEDASEPIKRDRSHLENTLKLNEDKPADEVSGEGL